MKTRSLKLRLLIAAAFAVFAALAAGWAAMSFLFERHVERRVGDDLSARGRDLIAALTRAPTGAEIALGDPRFATPAGGFYWQARGDGLLARSRSLWDEELAPATFAQADEWARARMEGPFDQRVIAVARVVRLGPDSAPIEIIVAEDHAHIAAATAEFSRELALFLALLWAVL
ncbi:MAG TPA: sensor histidine kinase, partial [Terricaulis sp.]|nr:sensor histidine kinase [Terricaulis sp.]